MISSLSSLEMIKLVNPDSNIFLWIAAFVADAAAVNPIGIKTILANCLGTFSIKGNPFFNNGRKSLPKNPPDCTIVDNRVFENLILADEPFAKALQICETCVLVNNNLCGKLFWSLESPIIFDESYFGSVFYCRL